MKLKEVIASAAITSFNLSYFNYYSLNPIQKFEYTKGKNSSDTSLIIDAMDILHTKDVDGFCIVSSDSDFTGLTKRIREEGMFVMGIGKKTTPIALVNSCEIFTYTENLTNTEEISKPVETVKSQQETKISKKATTTLLKISKEEVSKIDKAFEIAANEGDIILISKLGITLRQIDPSFDPRSFGFKNLTQLLENLEKFEIVKNDVNGLNHPLVRLQTDKILTHKN